MREVPSFPRNCVIMNCNSKAVAACNNCRMPVCSDHGRKIDQFYLCINCFELTKKIRKGAF